MILPGSILQRSAAAWLLPWRQAVGLASLPTAPPQLPPLAHLLWLVAITIMAALIAVAGRRSRRPLLRAYFTAATAATIAVAGASAWIQLHPDIASQSQLVGEATNPAASETCTSIHSVRYCAYPAYQGYIPRWAVAVDGVLKNVPQPPTDLTIRQLVDNDFEENLRDAYGTQGGEQRQQASQLDDVLQRFVGAASTTPRLTSSMMGAPIYVDMAWGGGPYQLSLSLQTAWSLVGPPTTWQHVVPEPCGDGCYEPPFKYSCIPLGQAREAIALWLAADGSPSQRAAFIDGLRNALYGDAIKVGRQWIVAYLPPVSGYQPALLFTGQSAALAREMLTLPDSRIRTVLAQAWDTWLNPQTSDTQLASALGLSPPVSQTTAPEDPAEPSAPLCT